MAGFDLIPSRTALVNVDMQIAFVEGTPLSAPNGVALLTLLIASQPRAVPQELRSFIPFTLRGLTAATSARWVS